MITVKANARSASYDSDDLITSGSAGIPCEFVLSSDFNGLSPIAVFEGSGTARDVALMGNTCVVPHEVLATAGGYLRIGIYAANSEGTIVIPTVWAGSKMILQGTTPSEVDPSEPTPSWVAQVQEAAAEALANSEEAIEIAGGAEAAAEEARESADEAAAAATAAGQSASAAGTAQTAAASARDAAVAAKGSAENNAQAAAGSATAAAGSAAAAAASEAAAREVEESIPEDYADLSADVSELKSQMGKKAPAIIADSDADYVHDDLNVSSIKFVGNDYAFETARYADKKNQLPMITSSNTTTGGVSIKRRGRFVTLDGTATSTADTQLINSSYEIPAGEYTLVAKFYLGNSNTNVYNSDLLFRFSINGTRLINYVDLRNLDGVLTKTANITLPGGPVTVYGVAGVGSGNVYDGMVIWYGLYPSDTVFVDTEEYVQSDGDLSYNVDNAPSIIDTVQHQSMVSYVVDTKTYVDDHIPSDMLTESDLVYLSPEMYGATGDGVTDDTVAFQSCINDAISNRIPLKAFGKYKITQTLEFAQSPSNSGRNYSYEINRIEYNGTDNYAVEISGSCGRFIFGYISSNKGGIKLKSVTNGATLNYIFANYVSCNDNCFETESISGGVYYNTIRILRPHSSNANCFVNGSGCGENSYYDSSCSCENGWAIYGINGRYYNFRMESNVKNGIYAYTGDSASIINPRWEELMNHYDAGVAGTVLKIVGRQVSILCIGPRIQLRCIDVSEMDKRDDVQTISYIVNGCKLQAEIGNNSLTTILGNNAYIRCGKIICLPEVSSAYTVTESVLDLRTDNPPCYPTRFNIDISSCDIYLSDSYCAIGYSSFIVDQSDAGKVCTIFKSDDDDTPIFDGAQRGAGIYKLTAYCEGDAQNSIKYLLNNDVWFVEKIG